MANINVTRLDKEAQADRDLPYEEQIIRGGVVNVDPWRPTPPRRAPELFAIGLVGGIAWLVVLLVLVIARTILCWGWDGCASSEAMIANGLMWLWLVLPVASAVVALALWAWGLVARTTAETGRMRIVRDPYGNPADVATIRQQSYANYLDVLRMATQASIVKAPYQQLRSVDAYSHTATAATVRPVETIEAAPQAPLVLIDSPREWLAWLDERPHLMLAAESGGGKSVLAGVVVAERARSRGDAVAVLDPHWSPRVPADEGRLVAKWGGVTPLATSHAEIRGALIALKMEYDRRLEQLRRGEVAEGQFRPRITVIIDEVPEVVKALKALDPKGADTWGATTTILGSGARKVNISVILLTQSPLVEDVGINSAMRKNFYRVALAADECRRLIGEEPDRDRKAALLEALRGRRYPAAVERQGEVWLLSRDGLLDMLPEHINADAWLPASPSRVPDIEPQETGLDQPAPSCVPDGDGDAPQYNEAQVVRALRVLRGRGKTRDEARAILARLNIEFRNSLWTEAGRPADAAEENAS